MPKGDTEKILSMANANNGIVTASMVSEAGISRECLRLLAADGRLERSARGVYYVSGIIADEFFNAHSMFKRGIFSHETALFLHGLTETTPVALSMAFPTAYNYSGAKSFGIICHSESINFYKSGMEYATTPYGNKVPTYNAERSLCDMLRTISHSDIQTVAAAFRKYVARPGADIPLLSHFSKELKVEKKLRSYLEVLL